MLTGNLAVCKLFHFPNYLIFPSWTDFCIRAHLANFIIGILQIVFNSSALAENFKKVSKTMIRID